MKFHKFASVFPLLGEDKLQELADDIRAHGLRMPIVTYKGEILDGRNRATACTQSGVKPAYAEFIGSDTDALEYVWSQNAIRRHLDKGQAAACFKRRELMSAELAEAVEAVREEAKERMKSGKADPPQTFGEGSKHDRETDAHRAKLAGTNRQYMNDADNLAAKAPDLLDEVADGKKSMPQAKAELKDRTAKKPKGSGAAALRAEDRKKAFAAYDKLSKALEDLRVRRKCDDALRTIYGVLERV